MRNDTVNVGGSAAEGGGMVVGYRGMMGLSRRATQVRQWTEPTRRETPQTHRQRHAPFRLRSWRNLQRSPLQKKTDTMSVFFLAQILQKQGRILKKTNQKIINKKTSLLWNATLNL